MGLNDAKNNDKHVTDLKNDYKNKNSDNNRGDKLSDQENYSYSRLSLLVNIWVAHQPLAVKRMDNVLFQSNLKDQIKQENLAKMMNRREISEKKKIGRKKDFQIEKTDFNFKKFCSQLESDEKYNPCMTFCPKIDIMYSNESGFISKKDKKVFGIRPGMNDGLKQKRNSEMIEEKRRKSLDFSVTKCRLKRRKLQVEVVEMIDDGVIRAIGDGKNIQNVRNCRVHLTGLRSGTILSGAVNSIDIDTISDDGYDKGKDTDGVTDRNTYRGTGIDGDTDIKHDYNITRRENQQQSQITNLGLDSLYYFQEHRSGDTAPVPLVALREEFHIDYHNNCYNIFNQNNSNNNNYNDNDNNVNNDNSRDNTDNGHIHNTFDNQKIFPSSLRKSKIIKVNYTYN